MAQTLRLFGFFFIVLALPLMMFLVGKQQELRQQASELPVEFLLSSVTKTTDTESNMKVALIAYARVDPINAVQVNLTYPQNKLDLVAIDTSESPFDQQTEQIADNGYITIARKTKTPQFGANPIATLTFKAKESTATSEIAVLSNSSVIRSTDSTSVFAPGRVVDASQLPGAQSEPKTVFDGMIKANNSFWDWLLTKLHLNS